MCTRKHIEKKESIFAEYWKVGLSFILLISGIIMNALELPFFREGYFSDMVCRGLSSGRPARYERGFGRV